MNATIINNANLIKFDFYSKNSENTLKEANGALGFTDRESNVHFVLAKTMDFHTPSEHSVEGKHFDVELQVHHYDPGEPDRITHTLVVFFDRVEGGNY